MRTKTLLFAAALLAACSTTTVHELEPAKEPEAGVVKKIALGAKIEVFGAT